MTEIKDAELHTPQFNRKIHKLLPGFLHPLLKTLDSARSIDTTLLSILTALSGMLRTVSVLHNGKWVGVNLYLHVIAESGSNKGDIIIGKHICDSISNYVQDQAKVAISDYELMKDHIPEVCGDKPVIPDFYLTANSSSARLNEQLARNDGAGLIFETELDTLVNSFKNTWGDFSTELRANFHNEPIRSVTLTRDRRIDNPRFSMVVSGTVDQVLSLYPSAENGAFSRGMFYVYREKSSWNHNAFLNEGYVVKEEIMSQLVKQSVEIYKQIANSNLKFKWRRKCALKNNRYFERLLTSYSRNFPGSDAIIKRMGLIMSKLAALLSATRLAASGSLPSDCGEEPLYIDPTDREITECLTQCLLEHSLVIYTNLKVSTTSISSREVNQQILLDCLPLQFSRKELISKAEERNIPSRTADRYCQELVSKGRIQKMSHGVYNKILLDDIHAKG